MEQQESSTEKEEKTAKSLPLIWYVVGAVLLVIATSYATTTLTVRRLTAQGVIKNQPDPRILQETVVPAKGMTVKVKWGDLGQKLIQGGAIDPKKLEEVYSSRGGLSAADKKLVYGTSTEYLSVNLENSGLILNLLWALGLANKNEILDKGPLVDPRYGGAGNFASTGGWSLAKGDAMKFYSKSTLITLTSEQQALVKKVAENIYRPCCDNSTYFPDCNHGMAMLAYLELAASQGATESELYQGALTLNSYWFPDTYMTLASYKQTKGTKWSKVDPKEILSAQYSSATGYGRILSETQPIQKKGGSGGGCGV